MAHSPLELSIGGKNDKYKANTERLNFFARGLFEDVNAEVYRWVKKEDFVPELFFLFINLYADSTLFFYFFWPVSGSKSRIIPQKHI